MCNYRINKKILLNNKDVYKRQPISTYRKKENCESKFTLEEAYRISKIADKSIEEIFFAN